MHCMKCGNELPEGAAFCPACGTATGSVAPPQAAVRPGEPAPPPAPTPSKGASAGIGCLVLIGIIVVIALIVPSGETGSGGSKHPEGTVPLNVTVDQLWNAYQANEAAAQSTYGDRLLRVAGTVDKVSLDMFDEPVIELRTANRYMPARAHLTDGAAPGASSLVSGQPVTLMCDNVRELASMPVLEDCSFAPSE